MAAVHHLGFSKIRDASYTFISLQLRALLSWLESFLRSRTQSVSVSGKSSNRLSLTCGVPQGSILGPILFLIYCTEVIAIAKRHGLGVHCALIRRRHPTVFPYCPSDGRQQGAATGGVRGRDPSMEWMNANRLRLNEDKTQFIGLGTPHQLSEVQCQKISLRGVDIQISTEVTVSGCPTRQQADFCTTRPTALWQVFLPSTTAEDCSPLIN